MKIDFSPDSSIWQHHLDLISVNTLLFSSDRIDMLSTIWRLRWNKGINFTNSVIFMLFSSIITPLLSNNLRLQASPQPSPERSPDSEIEINLKDFRWFNFPYFNKWCFNPPTPKIVANQTCKGLFYYWSVYQVIH